MDHNLLISELQSLIVESKRRNPEVKDAAERALELLRAGPLSKDALAAHSDELMAPVMLGCKTKVAKVVGISIAALQRLVGLGGVRTDALPDILQTLAIAANQAVDVQLKLLQTLLSLLTFNKDIHDDILGQALLLCFKLQESRVSVVSSTAAATLRQAVMLIFDRLSAPGEVADLPLSLPTDPHTELTITPSAADAFSIFSDLCLLTGGIGGGGVFGGEKEKPKILQLSTLQRTFGLELLESILSGYEDAVKQRPELLFLVRQSLTPLLLKLQSEKPTFSVELRICRLLFLLARSFMDQIPDEVEALLSLLIRLGVGESEGEEGSKKEIITPWTRVLALEVLRGICGDPNLLQRLYERYDAAQEGSKLFAKLVSSLGRLMHEKPNLLGVCAQMYGHNVPSEAPAPANASAGYLDMGLGIMASAASAGVSTVSNMMSSGGGLGNHSGMRQGLIEQHDKAEAPPIPDTYIFLLALGSLNNIAEGIFTTVAQTSEPPAAVSGMADSAWPALLAALSFLIGTNLSDSVFSEVLTALQDFTVACGLLGLNTPRDAFISTLGKYAVPPPVVSAMQTYMETPNPSRNNSVIGAESLGLTALGVGAPSGPPRLSERNLACLKSVVNTARILASTLGEAWHDVLETLQNANFLLAARRPPTKRPTGSPNPAASPTKSHAELPEDRGEMLSDIDADSIQGAINVLFDGTKELSDEAFSTFVTALCRLSSEMIGVEPRTESLAAPEQKEPPMPTSPRSPSLPSSMLSPTEAGSRRRESGLSVAGNVRSGDRSFSLSKLRVVATLNLHRLVTADPKVGWDVITHHLLAVSRHITAPSTLRMQATETLGELLISAVRATQGSGTQHKVFDVLVRQVDANPVSSLLSTDYDVRSAGFQTLNQILESSGHSLEVGWQTIFNMLEGVCKDIADTSSSDQSFFSSSRPSAISTRGNAALVRIAFPSLTLICTDFLSSLDPTSLRECISCLGSFGKQREDVNITLAAIGLLWNVSDAVQGIDKELWLYLLSVLLSLSQDARLEVRSSAMQTLFRCIELYGASLSPALWEDVIWKIIFPLLDSTTPDESQVLALTSAGNIFGTFFEPLSKLSTFEKMRDHLLQLLEKTFSNGPRQSCTAGLKAFERVLTALQTTQLPGVSDSFLGHSWASFVRMGESIVADGAPHSQEDLIALVRVASLLSRQHDLGPDCIKQLSTILRSAMTYDRSPEYRPDVDVMSPLQTSISELLAVSPAFDSSTKLSDLAEFASLAYPGDTTSKVSFVALSKFCMPTVSEIFDRVGNEEALYEDGTVERVIAAYALPIKLRYDCPAPSKYGHDPPLWRTALTTFAPILQRVVMVLESPKIPAAQYEAIWTQVLDVVGGILLADISNAGAERVGDDEAFVLPILGQLRDSIVGRLGDVRIPEGLVVKFGDTLRKASRLVHHEGSSSTSGTTQPAVEDGMERTRYWAFDLLISLAAQPASSETASDGKEDGDGRKRVAKAVTEALMLRFEESLRMFLSDARLRGQMPFGRIREEEMLYIFRHLATLHIWPGALTPPPKSSAVLVTAYSTSSRAHLFRLWRLLLDISYLNGALPRMWVFPREYRQLFGTSDQMPNGGSEDQADDVNAGDGGDLIEVGIKELGRRCMELFAEEISGKALI